MKSDSPNLHLTVLLITIFIIFIFPSASFSDEKTYNLDQCLEMARTRNPSVLASVERKNQAEWRKKSAYDDFLPKLNMDYSYTYLDDVTNIDADFIGIDEVSVTVHNNYRMGLHIDQPLFTGYRLIETYRLADLGLKEAVAGEELAYLEITYQTIRAYYSLLMTTQFQRVRDETVTTLTSHLNDSQQFYNNEIIPLNDLLESEVYLANAKQDARLSAGRTRIAKTNLATIIKEPVGPDFTVEDSHDTDLLASTLDILTNQALDTRPELKQANYGVEASKKQITLAKSTYFPTVALSASHNRFGGDAWVDGHGLSDLQNADETLVGVYATWELFAWGQTAHNVNEAAAASREANQRLIQVMDEIKLEVHDNYTNAHTSYANIATAQKAVDQARENLRMNQLRYKNQIATNTDVLDAQTLFTDTETKYYRAIYHYNIWLAGLARSVGVNSWRDLKVN